MDGVFVNLKRPKTKKALREAVEADPTKVLIEHTSMFSDGGHTNVADLPVGRYNVVGPDPYQHRNWYATITRLPNGKVKVS